ncbi:MAG: flagellar filament outer layer protein FlaA [Spirochaetota bacterium]
MRRSLILFIAVLTCFAMPALAEESTLIDFSELVADYPEEAPVNDRDTLLDFSDQASTVFTEEEKREMKSSLAIEQWEIDLSSSSEFTETLRNSSVKQAFVRDDADQFGGEAVLGVRAFFPEASYNGWALVRPPFEIPAYTDPTEVAEDGSLTTPQDAEGTGDKYVGRGVVKNVGTLKSLSLNAHGLNFPHGVSVILKDQNNEEQEIFLGNMNFQGWRRLEWENPNYISEVRDRELRTFPMYPNLQPMRKLVGIRIYRDGEMEGGDFVGYFKDINITYDLATLDTEGDIDNEQVWGILQEREAARRQAELRRLGNTQILRYLERLKQDQSDAEQQEAAVEEEGGEEE